MPTDTFFRLPEEKRQKLLCAARGEFARAAFPEVSINRIIQKAEIPRGSFYQYFQGKEDLFRYLLQGCHERLFGSLESALRDTGGDIFQTALALFDKLAELDASQQEPGFCKNLIANLRVRDQGILESLRRLREDRLKRLLPLVNRKALSLATAEELELAAELLQSLLRCAATELFAPEGDAAAVRERLVKKLELLRRGLSRRGEDANAC